jgi:hypothetical protein
VSYQEYDNIYIYSNSIEKDTTTPVPPKKLTTEEPANVESKLLKSVKSSIETVNILQRWHILFEIGFFVEFNSIFNHFS